MAVGALVCARQFAPLGSRKRVAGGPTARALPRDVQIRRARSGVRRRVGSAVERSGETRLGATLGGRAIPFGLGFACRRWEPSGPPTARRATSVRRGMGTTPRRRRSLRRPLPEVCSGASRPLPGGRHDRRARGGGPRAIGRAGGRGSARSSRRIAPPFWCHRARARRAPRGRRGDRGRYRIARSRAWLPPVPALPASVRVLAALRSRSSTIRPTSAGTKTSKTKALAGNAPTNSRNRGSG